MQKTRRKKMKRMAIYNNNEFIGWINMDEATILGKTPTSPQYKRIIKSRKGKILIEDVKHPKPVKYREPVNEQELVEIMVSTTEKELMLTPELAEMLKKYEK